MNNPRRLALSLLSCLLLVSSLAATTAHARPAQAPMGVSGTGDNARIWTRTFLGGLASYSLDDGWRTHRTRGVTGGVTAVGGAGSEYAVYVRDGRVRVLSFIDGREDSEITLPLPPGSPSFAHSDVSAAFVFPYLVVGAITDDARFCVWRGSPTSFKLKPNCVSGADRGSAIVVDVTLPDGSNGEPRRPVASFYYRGTSGKFNRSRQYHLVVQGKYHHLVVNKEFAHPNGSIGRGLFLMKTPGSRSRVGVTVNGRAYETIVDEKRDIRPLNWQDFAPLPDGNKIVNNMSAMGAVRYKALDGRYVVRVYATSYRGLHQVSKVFNLDTPGSASTGSWTRASNPLDGTVWKGFGVVVEGGLWPRAFGVASRKFRYSYYPEALVEVKSPFLDHGAP